jgi:hypothetical protein
MIALPSRATNATNDTPADRDAGMEIAQNAIPTPAWTAPRTRRPQRPTGHFDSVNGKTRKMTSRTTNGRLLTIAAAVASLR